MAISATTAVPAATSSGTTSTSNSSSTSSSLGGLSATDFINLMVSELQNQDPLNPDSADSLLNQTAALSQMEGINQLNTSITQLLSGQQLAQTANLIGKEVTYQDTNSNSTQSGTVSGVSLVNGQTELTVGSNQVPLSQVQSIQ